MPAKKAAKKSKSVPKKKASKPVAKKKVVKKPAAKKAVSKKKATARKPAPKKPAKKTVKKPAPKKPPVKKAAPKPPVKKVAPKPVKAVPTPPPKPVAKPTPPPEPIEPPKPTRPKKLAPAFAPSTMDKFRAQLQEERVRHLHQAEELLAEADELVKEGEQGDTQFDEESGEGDTISVERERGLQLSAEAMHVVEEIDRALERFADGSFGYCQNCWNKIPVARLEALPYTELCVECKARGERRY